MDELQAARLTDRLTRLVTLILGAATIDAKTLDMLNSAQVRTLIDFIYTKHPIIKMNDDMSRHYLVTMWQNILSVARDKLQDEFYIPDYQIQWQIIKHEKVIIYLRLGVNPTQPVDYVWYPNGEETDKDKPAGFV
jgi:hypothetical protein